MWEETQEKQMNYTRDLTTVLGNRLLGNVAVYPTIGNHGETFYKKWMRQIFK